MTNINKPYTFSANTTASSSQVNDNFDTIYNDYNGGISSTNLADGAVTLPKINGGTTAGVLTTDASGNVTAAAIGPLIPTTTITASMMSPSTFSFVRARKNATQAVADGAAAVVAYTSEQADVLGEYDTSTSTFTAGSTGLYYVRASLRWTTTFTGTNVIAIQVNSSNIIESNFNNVYNYEVVEISAVVSLAATNTVRIYWSNSSGASRTIDSNAVAQELIIARVV